MRLSFGEPLTSPTCIHSARQEQHVVRCNVSPLPSGPAYCGLRYSTTGEAAAHVRVHRVSLPSFMPPTQACYRAKVTTPIVGAAPLVGGTPPPRTPVRRNSLPGHANPLLPAANSPPAAAGMTTPVWPSSGSGVAQITRDACNSKSSTPSHPCPGALLLPPPVSSVRAPLQRTSSVRRVWTGERVQVPTRIARSLSPTAVATPSGSGIYPPAVPALPFGHETSRPVSRAASAAAPAGAAAHGPDFNIDTTLADSSRTIMNSNTRFLGSERGAERGRSGNSIREDTPRPRAQVVRRVSNRDAEQEIQHGSAYQDENLADGNTVRRRRISLTCRTSSRSLGSPGRRFRSPVPVAEPIREPEDTSTHPSEGLAAFTSLEGAPLPEMHRDAAESDEGLSPSTSCSTLHCPRASRWPSDHSVEDADHQLPAPTGPPPRRAPSFGGSRHRQQTPPPLEIGDPPRRPVTGNLLKRLRETQAELRDVRIKERTLADVTNELQANVSILQEATKRMLCVVCLDAEIGSVFLPCGHVVCCTNCADTCDACPCCRQAIKRKTRAFFP
mmetsp:Transcript_151244/g.262108  ORF Transcript_151244/g.262108 Transcript_151244/m.262108 type:complete len:556 (-) Transcript_151244:51-1718(-)